MANLSRVITPKPTRNAMRLATLGLVAILVALGAGNAAAYDDQRCEDVGPHTEVCVAWHCHDHHCVNRTVYAVWTTCDHPMPTATCVTVSLE